MQDDAPKNDPDLSHQAAVVPAGRAAKLAATGAASVVVPAIVADAGEHATRRFLEFFAATIRNRNTRTAYLHAVSRFFAWCEHHQLRQLADIEPLHVAAYIEVLGKSFEKPTVKQHLAAIRMLFDWLVTGQVVAANPAHAVRGPKHVVKTGKTTVLDAPLEKWMDLLIYYAEDWDSTFRTDRTLYFTQEYWYLFTACIRADALGRPLARKEAIQRMRVSLSEDAKVERIKRAVDDKWLTEKQSGRDKVLRPTDKLRTAMDNHLQRTLAEAQRVIRQLG